MGGGNVSQRVWCTSGYPHRLFFPKIFSIVDWGGDASSFFQLADFFGGGEGRGGRLSPPMPDISLRIPRRFCVFNDCAIAAALALRDGAVAKAPVPTPFPEMVCLVFLGGGIIFTIFGQTWRPLPVPYSSHMSSQVKFDTRPKPLHLPLCPTTHTPKAEPRKPSL